MASLVGITTQTNSQGILTSITIDLKKHPEAIPQLVQLGYISKSEEEIEREEFYKKFNKGITPEELRKSAYDHIDSLKWEK